MAKSLRNAVVVVTGASSGIGRATARAFALRGATVVLAARRQTALEDVARECEELGGRALAVPTDVTDPEAIEHLAAEAVRLYDRIDVWVNNAAVTLFARLEEAPLEDYQQVIQTNVMGYVHGARAAIRQFREQGEGCLVNVSSMVAYVGQPYTSAYVSSKWAIRGLSECLRMEVRDAPGIRVCGVFPASIDTPFFEQGANHSGRAAKPMKPVYPPEQVAEAIVSLARHPRREVVVGAAGKMIAALKWLCPRLAESMMARNVETDHFLPGRPAAPTSGNLFSPFPDEDARLRGGWILHEHGAAPSRKPLLAAAALGVAAVAVPTCLYLHRRHRSGRGSRGSLNAAPLLRRLGHHA